MPSHTLTDVYSVFSSQNSNCSLGISFKALESLLANKNAPVSCLTNITCTLYDTLKQQGKYQFIGKRGHTIEIFLTYNITTYLLC